MHAGVVLLMVCFVSLNPTNVVNLALHLLVYFCAPFHTL